MSKTLENRHASKDYPQTSHKDAHTHTITHEPSELQKTVNKLDKLCETFKHHTTSLCGYFDSSDKTKPRDFDEEEIKIMSQFILSQLCLFIKVLKQQSKTYDNLLPQSAAKMKEKPSLIASEEQEKAFGSSRCNSDVVASSDSINTQLSVNNEFNHIGSVIAMNEAVVQLKVEQVEGEESNISQPQREHGVPTDVKIEADAEQVYTESTAFLRGEDTQVTEAELVDSESTAFLRGEDTQVPEAELVEEAELGSASGVPTRRRTGRRKTYICNICYKSFANNSNLTNHIRSVHFQEKHRCEHCGVVYSNKYRLIAHVKQAHLGKGFICEHCSKSFSAKHRLSEHLLTHTGGQKRFICDICNQSFTQQCGLQRHIKNLHHGEKFTCAFCSKIFKNKERFKLHQKTHLGDGYICEHCSKSFTSNEGLTYHLTTHTVNRKLLPCSACSRSFTHSSSLARHMRNIHLGEKYNCEHCSKAYTCKENLVNHIKHIHPTF